MSVKGTANYILHCCVQMIWIFHAAVEQWAALIGCSVQVPGHLLRTFSANSHNLRMKT